MTTYLPSGRPAWAVTMWMDDSAIYMELPVTGGPPYITRYELCDAGLAKALGMMRDLYRKAAPTGGGYPLTRHPILARQDKTKTGKDAFSSDQREAARNVLKRLKIT